MNSRRAVFLSISILSSGFLGCCDKKSIPKAKARLYSSAAKDRNDGALELARCGSRAKTAVPRLASLLYDENVGVQSAAAYALRQIDTAEARDALEQAIIAKKNR